VWWWPGIIWEVFSVDMIKTYTDAVAAESPARDFDNHSDVSLEETRLIHFAWLMTVLPISMFSAFRRSAG
jgi:hypothetical protein